jgi:hypothetical protein
MASRLLVVGALCVAVLVISGTASAATYTHDCPPADAGCLALAERLEQLDADTVANLPGPAGPISGTVALSSDDADRLDLSSWGIWFLCGLTVCLLFASLWHRVWKFWRD